MKPTGELQLVVLPNGPSGDRVTLCGFGPNKEMVVAVLQQKWVHDDHTLAAGGTATATPSWHDVPFELQPKEPYKPMDFQEAVARVEARGIKVTGKFTYKCVTHQSEVDDPTYNGLSGFPTRFVMEYHVIEKSNNITHDQHVIAKATSKQAGDLIVRALKAMDAAGASK